MGPSPFDALSRSLAGGITRRLFVQGAAGAAAAIGLHRRTRSVLAQAEGEATGVAVCVDLECPPGKSPDLVSCTCVCDIDCPPNYAPDPSSCICYCMLGDNYQCPRDDQVFDAGYCACVCANDDCPGDAVLDPESCLCYCPDNIVCEEGEEIDPDTCECECNRTCDEPFELDGCVCICPLDECPKPKILDPDGCACICDPTSLCANPKIIDPDTCGCVCPIEANCSAAHVWDDQLCNCICPPDSVCAYPQVTDPETCQCVCPPESVCSVDRIKDPQTCECVCPPNTTICKDRCVEICTPIEAYDDDCVCTPIVCPPDRVLTCTCACPEGMQECKGTCLPACAPDEVFDDKCRCACRPNISCADGYAADPKTCDCVCALTTCDSVKVVDLDACTCVCPDDITCRKNQIVNPDTCQCVCEPGTVLETISVPCGTTSVVSTTTLEVGVIYTLRASGTCKLGTYNDGDAEWAYNPLNPNDIAKLLDQCNGKAIGVGIDDPVIDYIKTPFWGAYNTSHIYTTAFTGKGAPITLNYHDCYYQDNVGSITVEILCP